MTTHTLLAAPDTIQVGVIDRAHAPRLRVASGDEVQLSTLNLWAGEVAFGDPFEKVVAARQRYAGKGPHTITGPIAVAGARRGDVLRVDVLQLDVGPTAMNLMTPAGQSRGVLAADFPEGSVRHFRLDRETMTADFGYGIAVPLRPFLGIMGVAPPDDGVHVSSVPGPFGGNIDCAELVAGTTLYLPVWMDDAMFYAGDAHAAQGHGEVNGTAFETTMDSARLRLTVETGRTLEAPQAETPTHWITMDFDADLHAAARRALAAMVDFIAQRADMPRVEAYRLCSVAADLVVTQMVNGNRGIHVKLAKNIFKT
ncbi:acetamidase/formamidase family protein [Ramlibacter sp.]|uniref:acetamidase/formamidase family protein n=1 Tax=Ramlibacter sp. TaxID=1917967 RepID=UPI003D0F35CE